MRTTDYIANAYRTFVLNPRRTALTMLGLVIGIASVIMLNVIGLGAERAILQTVSILGTNTIFISSGPGDGGGQPNFVPTDPLRMRDVRALEALDDIGQIVPIVLSSGQTAYLENDLNAMIFGSYPEIAGFYSLSLDSGRFFDDSDVSSSSRVGVIGSTLAEKLFPNEDPVGKRIKIQKKSFEVIGVLEPLGVATGFADVNQRVYMPISAAQSYLTGKTSEVSFIGVLADTDLEVAISEIRFALRDSRDIENPTGDLALDDFRVSTQQELVEIISTVISALQLFMSAIAAISLIVGGIGIMNIMLVAVSERTREIGLRKALGATSGSITTLFVVEAMSICGVGGTIGIGVGLGVGAIISAIAGQYVPGWGFAFSWDMLIIAVGVSLIIGVIFGVYPARRAGKLDPITSLRYE